MQVLFWQVYSIQELRMMIMRKNAYDTYTDECNKNVQHNLFLRRICRHCCNVRNYQWSTAKKLKLYTIHMCVQVYQMNNRGCSVVTEKLMYTYLLQCEEHLYESCTCTTTEQTTLLIALPIGSIWNAQNSKPQVPRSNLQSKTLPACCCLHQMTATIKGDAKHKKLCDTKSTAGAMVATKEGKCNVLNCSAQKGMANPPSRNLNAAADIITPHFIRWCCL